MRRFLLVFAGLFLLVVFAALAGGYLVVFSSNTPSFEGERGVKIPRGAGFDTVVDSLESNGLLRSASTFRLLGKTTGWANQVKAGYYTFESGASNYDMINAIRKGLQSPIKLTVPPGVRPDILSHVAGQVMEFDADTFRLALSDSILARSLGTDVEHLFSYMMPETYSFYWLNDAPTVITKIKKQFDAYYDKEIAPFADTLGLSKDEIVTMASIVEWETGIPAEKPIVAGVYLNRLRIGMPLQADPTVQYAIIKKENKKRALLYADYQIDSPFNTYRFRGLPPAPITNPAPSSLKAVVRPERHDYLYFVAQGDGSHVFSRTFDEHRNAAARYRELMKTRREAAGK